jgi:hypothetical protein
VRRRFLVKLASKIAQQPLGFVDVVEFPSLRVPITFSIELVQASERRSFAGRPRR